MVKVGEVYISASQNPNSQLRTIIAIENDKVTIASESHKYVASIIEVEDLIKCGYWHKSYDV